MLAAIKEPAPAITLLGVVMFILMVSYGLLYLQA